ncbi:MAG TPA: crossover junction endodeoxyribonuclease RuvC [Acidimicrobiales bacterium]|jgi:crossover junction endodeoxyribonuclease RuvC|nr:crossover junction endodeoxyribonuclease RuvC [Acidimicrobiales bacterium]
MFVLGIDPGLTRCGYGLVTRGGAPATFVARAAGTIATDPEDPVERRLFELTVALRELLVEHRPDAVVVERLFFQTNARTATGVAQASGVALACAVEHGCAVAQYTSNEVKLAVVGYGAATKHQVQTMVARQVGLASPPSPDAADALALAVCHLVGASLRAAVSAAEARS